MGLKECEIKLDNPNSTYYSGQTIHGTVMYTFDSPKKVRGIKIRFLGEAQTKWVETETRKKEDGTAEEHRTDVTGTEEYFQINYYLLGGANATETELPAGVHTYPFTCTLPPALPSSFEAELGFVRYTVKVTLDRPWKFDQDTKMAFTVISPLDMNLMEKVGEPEKLVMEKTFCCFCCKSAPLSVVVSLPVKGYVSGQIIPLLFEIDNRSNVEVEKIKFAFRKHVAFHSMAPRTTRTDEKVLAELTLGPYMPGDQKTVKQMIEIPSVPPTNLGGSPCSIIDLFYDLQIVCEVKGFHTNLDGIIPITIGTVPLKNFQPSASHSFDISSMPTQPVSPQSIGGAVGWNTQSSDYQINLPPPTFHESAFHANTIMDKEDNEFTRLVGNTETFAPRYPVLNYKPTAPALD